MKTPHDRAKRAVALLSEAARELGDAETALTKTASAVCGDAWQGAIRIRDSLWARFAVGGYEAGTCPYCGACSLPVPTPVAAAAEYEQRRIGYGERLLWLGDPNEGDEK